MLDLLTVFLVGTVAGLCASLAIYWHVARRTYSLECDVADLQNKMLHEIKKRANASRGVSEFEKQILEKVQETRPAQSEPWFMPYVAGKMKG